MRGRGCIELLAHWKRRPAAIRAGVRHSMPYLTSARYNSMQKIPIQSTSHPTEWHLDKGKEKAVEDSPMQGRTALIEKVLFETATRIEDSKEWEYINARYPGMTPTQVSLVTLLDGVLERTKKARARLSASELLKLHDTVLKADRRLQKILIGQRRFHKSAVAYSIMLKYASYLQDSKSLNDISRQALIWKQKQGTGMLSRREKQPPRFVHPRVAAAENLTRLIRNLFVSLSVKRGARVKRDNDTVMLGLEMPSDSTYVQRGDDAMAISTLLRQRIGAFRLDRNDDGHEIIKLAKNAQRSRYPLLHQSSRIKRINRLAERGLLQMWMRRCSTEETEIDTAQSLSATMPERKDSTSPESFAAMSTTATPETLPTVSKQNAEFIALLKYPNGSDIDDRRVEILRYSLFRWQRELSRRSESKWHMVNTIKQFRIKSGHFGMASRNAESEPETLEHIKDVIPAWLVLTILRQQIESGDVRRAEKVVEIYLEGLSKVYPGKEMSEIIPVNASRVHVVTSPFVPPNGSSLLNGILRAHLNSGAKDCFEHMLKVINKWAIKGKSFKKAVLKKRVRNKNNQVKPPAYARCLVPNQDTVMIFLEALRHRLFAYSLGKKLIEEMWYRWGIVGFQDEREGESLLEPLRHQTLRIPQQAFTILMKWAQKDKRPGHRQKRIDNVMELEERWRKKAFDNQHSFLGASVKHKLAWKKVSDFASRQKNQGESGSKENIDFQKEESRDHNQLYFTRN